MDLERTKKNYRLQNRTIAKVEQLVSFENSNPANALLDEINDREIIERAINHYHSHVFGKDVFDDAADGIVNEIENRMNLQFKIFVEEFAKGMNTLFYGTNVLKMMTTLLMYQADINPVNVANQPGALDTAIDYMKPLIEYLESLEVKNATGK